MARKRNKFSHTILRNFIILVALFILMVFFSTILFFNSYKEKSIKAAHNNYTLTINYYSEKLLNTLLLNDNQNINFIKEEIEKTDYIKEIKIKYKKFLFTKDTLLFKTPSFNDKTWAIGNIEIDVKYGKIIKLSNAFAYEFIPSLNFNINEDLIIRYQAYKNGKIRNFVTKLNFSLHMENNKNLLKKEDIPGIISDILQIDFKDQIIELNSNSYNLGQIVYVLDKYKIEEEIYIFIKKLFIYTFIVFLPILIVINFYQRFVYRSYVLKPIAYLNSYVDDIIANKFRNLSKNNIEDTEDFIGLTDKISKMSKKTASLVNELNINKETLERKLSTDNLTGLPNQKIFELDIKSMFVSAQEAYIFILRIDKLAEITKLNGSVNTNAFIQAFVNSINNTLRKTKGLDSKLYRFYGSEFTLIAKKIDFETAYSLAEAISGKLIADVKSYNLPDNVINIGGTPFDVYGSIDSILKSANEAYKEALSREYNSFEIIKETEVQEENRKLEEEILEILNKNDFKVDLVTETYNFEDRLLMKELRPKILNNEGDLIPVGSFVSICEKIKKATLFDKNIIDRALVYISSNNIDYKLAINISMDSALDKDFLSYLKNLKETKNDIMDHIVLSITSYTASLNMSNFKKFVKTMNTLNIEVLMKRYQNKEFDLEELNGVNLDYLRLHREYTTNIASDLSKKHKLKNVIIYGELNEIKIMGDSVQIDQDYELLEKLDLYGTSR